MAYLSSTGFLGPDVLAVHCIKVTGQDIEIMARSGVNVSHNPVSNMYLAHGVAPIPRMIDAGITVALATDGAASNNNVDYIEDLKFASLLHKAHTENPKIIDAHQVLDMATIQAAEAIGKGDELGSLEVGKRADLFICDFDHHVSSVPSYDPVAALVYAASSECVRTVMVDGRLIMDEGTVTTIPDTDELLRRSKAAAHDLVRRAGVSWRNG
jgi:5-methylthioadenosine/S-adenosylhomocysteine deaminase